MSLCGCSEFMIGLTVHLLEVVLRLICHPCVGLKCRHLTTERAQDSEKLSCWGSLLKPSSQPRVGSAVLSREGSPCVPLFIWEEGRGKSAPVQGISLAQKFIKTPKSDFFSLFLRNRWLFILRWTCRKLPVEDDLSAGALGLEDWLFASGLQCLGFYLLM